MKFPASSMCGLYGQTYVFAPSAPSANNDSDTNTQERANTQVRPYEGRHMPCGGKYDPAVHHRRSVRLRGYDYSQAGAYFVTLCVQDRQCLFGDIVDGEMRLNDAGLMICKWYGDLSNKFADIECDAFVCMPNHIHFIVVNVGADLRVRPGSESVCRPNGQTHRSAPTDAHVILGEHIGSPLQRVVQWFKTMSTNEYIRGVKQNGWPPFPGKLWQRNYWEHIVRNEPELHRIREYIHNNPAQWILDKLIAGTEIREPVTEYGMEAWMV